MSTLSQAASSLDLDELGAAVAEVVSSEPRVLAVYVFGSRVRGNAHDRSDLDLAVLFTERVPVMELLEMGDRLEKRLAERVDLVDLGRASAFLALDVIRGERIYCTDSARCDEFDLYVLRRAGDLEPFERERRRVALGFDPREARGRKGQG